MKAILVINVPNDIDISKVRIGGDGNIYFIRDGEKASIVGNIRNIKPLPQKKSHQEYSWNAEKIETINNYENGWNDCLDLITGETE